MAAVLEDVDSGVCSVLEHVYLIQVERAHGLPVGRRQAPAASSSGRRLFRDVLYEEQEQVVELDGRLFHDSTWARENDLERDLDAAVAGADTVRLGYGQVMNRPCETARKIGLVLQRRGWQGKPVSCADCGGSVQPG